MTLLLRVNLLSDMVSFQSTFFGKIAFTPVVQPVLREIDNQSTAKLQTKTLHDAGVRIEHRSRPQAILLSKYWQLSTNDTFPFASSAFSGMNRMFSNRCNCLIPRVPQYQRQRKRPILIYCPCKTYLSRTLFLSSYALWDANSRTWARKSDRYVNSLPYSFATKFRPYPRVFLVPIDFMIWPFHPCRSSLHPPKRFFSHLCTATALLIGMLLLYWQRLCSKSEMM